MSRFSATYLRMNVQLLADESVQLKIRSAIPRNRANVLASEHVTFGNGIPTTASWHSHALCSVLVLLVLWRLVEPSYTSLLSLRAISSTNHIVMLLPGIFVRHTTLLLGSLHCATGIDSIIVAKVVEPNVVHGIEARLCDLLHDAVTTPIDAVVLKLH